VQSSLTRKETPDPVRLRRRGGAPIEVKRAVFESRRLHRKQRHQEAWELLMTLPAEFDDYRELVDERLIMATWAKIGDHSLTCLWSKWLVTAEPESLENWFTLEDFVSRQDGPLAALEVLREAEKRFPGHNECFPDWEWISAQRLCQAGRIDEAQGIVKGMLEADPSQREEMLDDENFQALWPFLRREPLVP